MGLQGYKDNWLNMHQNSKNRIFIFLLFFSICCFAQNSISNIKEQKEIKYPDFYPTYSLEQNIFEVNLSVTDTVIIVKKSTRRHQYAAKVNVEINVPEL